MVFPVNDDRFVHWYAEFLLFIRGHEAAKIIDNDHYLGSRTTG